MPSSLQAGPGGSSSRTAGPIKTLKRTFSSSNGALSVTTGGGSAAASSSSSASGTSAFASSRSNAATSSTAVARKPIQLSPSAYDCTLDDDDDDDWGLQINSDDLQNAPPASRPKASVAATARVNVNLVSASSLLAANSNRPKPGSAAAAGAPSRHPIPPTSPPRAPQPAASVAKSSQAPQLPPPTQWMAPGFRPPSLPKCPSVDANASGGAARPTSNANNARPTAAPALAPATAGNGKHIPFAVGSSMLDQHAYEQQLDHAGFDASTSTNKPTSATQTLRPGALNIPFGRKPEKSQPTLNKFVVRAGSVDSNASNDSSATIVSVPGRKRPSTSDLWDPENYASAPKAARTSSNLNDGKGKARGNGIGSLNVKQQIVLSAEQQKVLKTVVEGGKNVFFTGSAGTGKSILLREIISSLRRKYANRGADRVAITASTGMAAANIGGTTIHSFGGIGLGIGSKEDLVNFVKKNRKAPGRWLRTEVLIIDEVSMLDGDLFDKLAYIAKRFRKKLDKPFGGIQLIVTGDFFQLPPVNKNAAQMRFAFEAEAWKECIDMTVNLTKVFRQRDTEFIDMLNEMRFGRLSEASITKFKKLKRQPHYDDGIEPTELFPLRDQVENANNQRLAALPGNAVVFHAFDDGDEPPDKLAKTLENILAPKVLILKVDAQVMLLKNMDNGLVNGSVGRVVAFKSLDEPDDDDWGKVPEEFTSEVAQLKHEPSAGANVAAGASVAGGAAKKGKTPAVLEKVPVVEWKMPDGSKLRMRMTREEFKVDDVGDKVKARRKQFPMICAWAMSIHKSQGQTLERVKCDLGKIFEKGQAYVALSRATCLDGLQVLNFDPKRVLAHPKVVTWTKTLTTLDK